MPVGILSTDDPAAAAASGPKSSEALVEHLVERARDGEADYLEVSEAGRQTGCSAGEPRLLRSIRAPRCAGGGQVLPPPVSANKALDFPTTLCFCVFPCFQQETARDFQGQLFQKCKPVMKVWALPTPALFVSAV